MAKFDYNKAIIASKTAIYKNFILINNNGLKIILIIR